MQWKVLEVTIKKEEKVSQWVSQKM